MIAKYTSCKRVIAKVLADLDMQEGQKRISDMIEWCGHALEKIGAFPQFVVKVTGRDEEPLLVLSDYQVRLPMGLHAVLQVIYADSTNGPFHAMRYATGNFDYNRLSSYDNTSTTNQTIPKETELVTTTMSLYNLSYEAALYKLNTESATRDLVTGLLTPSDSPTTHSQSGFVESSGFTYVVQGDYIKCNRRNGYLMVAYQSIPLDIDGYPLIPDDASFIDALYWYIVMKLYYPEWVSGRIRDAVYYDAKRSWNYYSKQAYGNALMPNSDQLESIKNTWLRLVPQLDAHSTFYTTLSEPENIFKQ